MTGVFVIRNDLTALEIWRDDEGQGGFPPNDAEYIGFNSTSHRMRATDFRTEEAAAAAIKRHDLKNCVVVTFK